MKTRLIILLLFASLAALGQTQINTNQIKDGAVTNAKITSMAASKLTSTVSGTNGGTGVNNGSFTITLAANFATSGSAITLTSTGSTNVTLPTTGTLATRAGAETFTNKRITARVQSVTSSATVTPNADDDDAVKVTAQAANLTLANPSGTPTAMQAMVVRIKDNGTSRTLTYGSQYRAIGVNLPVVTTVSKILYLGLVWNSDDSKWDVVGLSLEQ